MAILYPKPILRNVLMELRAIRNNITTCDIASITDIIQGRQTGGGGVGGVATPPEFWMGGGGG